MKKSDVEKEIEVIIGLEALGLTKEVAEAERKRTAETPNADEQARRFAVAMSAASATMAVVRGFFAKGSGLYFFAKGDPVELVDEVAAHLERKRVAKVVGRGRSGDDAGSVRALLFMLTTRFRSAADEQRQVAKKRDRAIELTRDLLGKRQGEAFDIETGHWLRVESAP